MWVTPMAASSKEPYLVKQLSGNIQELSLSKMNQTESKKAKNWSPRNEKYHGKSHLDSVPSAGYRRERCGMFPSWILTTRCSYTSPTNLRTTKLSISFPCSAFFCSSQSPLLRYITSWMNIPYYARQWPSMRQDRQIWCSQSILLFLNSSSGNRIRRWSG